MTDVPWFALLDSRFAWAALGAVLAGLARGFSGFGAALIFIPIASIAYDPKVSIVALWLADGLATAPFLPPHLRRAHWPEVGPLLIGSTATLPVGVWVLATANPTPLRWAVCLFVLASTAALASGWRYRGRPGVATSGVVGAVAGFANGSVGIGGPPLVLFWLGGQASAAQARSNIFAYFAVTTLIGMCLYLWQGLFALPILILGLAAMPFYIVPLKLGDRLFRRGSETTFRRVAYLLCGAAGIAGLPVW